MESINIFGENRFETYTKIRKACRGIVISNGMILLTYEVNTDQWFIPGGGLESGESLEACCVREAFHPLFVVQNDGKWTVNGVILHGTTQFNNLVLQSGEKSVY